MTATLISVLRTREADMEATERECGLFCKVCMTIGTLLLVWLCYQSCVDGVVRTVELEEEQTRKWVAQGYKRPLAYRLSSPDGEQMDRLHHILQVMEVRNAK